MRGRPLTLSPAAATRPHSHSPLRQVARREAGREGGGQRGSQRGARRRRGVAGGRHCLRLLKRGNEPLGKEEWRRGVEQANLLSSSLFILSARPAVPTHARSCSSNANSENESPLRGNTTPASLSPSTQHNTTHTHTHTHTSFHPHSFPFNHSPTACAAACDADSPADAAAASRRACRSGGSAAASPAC